MTLSSAIKYANRIVQLLEPHCDRIHIAGSVRREKAIVKDIEIVCLPKTVERKKDLFEVEKVRSAYFIYGVNTIAERVIKGKPEGRYMQLVIKGTNALYRHTDGSTGIKLDLFMPKSEDYFRMLAIRTGSWEYSNLVIATAWKRLGWCGAGEHGLRRVSDCEEIIGSDNKTKWKLKNFHGEVPPVWRSEQELFAWLGIAYLEPKYREIPESKIIGQ